MFQVFAHDQLSLQKTVKLTTSCRFKLTTPRRTKLTTFAGAN
jgi:hypothetical protein